MTTSNASGTTQTTMTLLDDISSSNGGFAYTQHNGDDSLNYSASLSSVNSSALGGTSSLCHSDLNQSATMMQTGDANPKGGMEVHRIYNYRLHDYVSYSHASDATCEDICLDFCRSLEILPTTRLLFGMRVQDSDTEWAVPGRPLRAGVQYCFRMRFKVPSLDTQLLRLDLNAYEYLYKQMRYDMVHEFIPEIRYPAKKNNVMGLGVMDMYIDLMEQRGTVEQIEANYKRYLPRKILRAHTSLFVRPEVRHSFQQVRSKNYELARVKWYYVQTIHSLAPNYLLETFVAIVNSIPDDEQTDMLANSNGVTHMQVYVKVDQYDSAEPGLKVARIAAEDKLKWVLVAKLENIYALCIVNESVVRLEITGFPCYDVRFSSKVAIESFITYLGGYVRLTSKWAVDLCVDYPTPSLQELRDVLCHGPIGATFSFAKIREKSNKCGSYIIRQCEKEYDTYYIDINTKSTVTETFKITKDNSNAKWILHLNDRIVSCNNLVELANSVSTENGRKFRIKPSPYDKPPLLLICLPKNLQKLKNATELSEADLQRKRPQIFFPKDDFEWYENSEVECDNGKMHKVRADWVQRGSFKEVPIILKTLKNDSDFAEFMKLAGTWSQIDSPQCIKFYGITLCTPYTMVLEYAKYGALNELLQRVQEKVSVRALLNVVLGLMRAVVYLQELGIIHGYIRCCNLYATKLDLKTNQLVAKLADPGFPRPYSKEDLPWIPFEYHKNLNGAKDDARAEFWAFATTIWEIFARGKNVKNLTTEMLRRNFNLHGGILPMPGDDCPDEMYDIMMDGWSESDTRFNPQGIFSTLVCINEKLASYDTPTLPLEHESANGVHGLMNGHSLLDVAEDSATSGNSTTCDRAPLVQHQQRNRHHNPFGGFRPRGNYFSEARMVRQIPNGKVVVYKDVIGEGHYGTVYLGELRYNSVSEQVAIKTLKSFNLFANEDFNREIQIMQTLDHPNIVKIKQWMDNPISIIMEYLEGGSFLVYLVSGKPNLTNERLLRFALDIAQGMKYLRNKEIIHRDLAARNILVDRDSVKISDFGLAQKADSDGYYLAQSVREIPIKWYSPESIKTAKFSYQSDVWSYGVTLFEMFSRGEVPNLEAGQELTQNDFLDRLERGERLRKPQACPDIVYDQLMMRCWTANPKMRPTFDDIIEEIQSISAASENGVSI